MLPKSARSSVLLSRCCIWMATASIKGPLLSSVGDRKKGGGRTSNRISSGAYSLRIRESFWGLRISVSKYGRKITCILGTSLSRDISRPRRVWEQPIFVKRV